MVEVDEGKLVVAGGVKELEEKLEVTMADVVECIIVLEDGRVEFQPGYAADVVVGIVVNPVLVGGRYTVFVVVLKTVVGRDC